MADPPKTTAATAAPKQKGWMSITVQDAATKAPIAGASITVSPTTPPADASGNPGVAPDGPTPSGIAGIVTPRSGKWASKNPSDSYDKRDALSAGTGAGKKNVPQYYSISVVHPGYGVADPTSGVVAQGPSVTTVALAPTSAPGGLKVPVALSQALVCATINVTDDSNNPVVGAKILVAPVIQSTSPGAAPPAATWPTDPLPDSPNTPAAVALPTGSGDDLTRTDDKGNCLAWFQPLGTAGSQWQVWAQKPGYAPTGATTGGDATTTFDLTTAPANGQTTVSVKMTNVWGSLTNSKITVGTLTFPKWYNAFIAPYVKKGKTDPPLGWPPTSGFPGIGTFPMAPASPGGNYAFIPIGNAGGFGTMFDQPTSFWASTLTVNEFLALFLIFMNEMGGGFTPDVGETDGAKNLTYSLKYCFNTVIPGTSVNKASFNTGSKTPDKDPEKNIVLAGDRLKFLKNTPPSWFDATLLADTTVDDDFVKAWNGKVYPNPATGSNLEKAARECDFYKCRGHGCVQLTWRPAYVTHAYAAIKAKDSSFTSIDNVSCDQWEKYMHDPDVYYPMIKSYLTNTVGAQVKAANRDQWFGFGRALGGGTPYGLCFEWRARVLLAGLQRDDVAPAPLGAVKFT